MTQREHMLETIDSELFPILDILEGPARAAGLSMEWYRVADAIIDLTDAINDIEGEE